MTEVTKAILTVVSAWIILFCIIAGLGQWARRLFGLRTANFGAWLDAFWTGYVVVIGALHIWHLVLPIDWRLCLILGIAGASGCITGARSLKRPAVSLTRAGLVISALAPLVVWLTNRALSSQLDFDSAMYHINTIRWANDYPVVLGLGNLHYRLAFNQSFFLFVAALNVYPFFNQGFHIANSLLVIVLVAQLISSTIYTLFRPAEMSVYRLMSAFFVPVIIYRASRQPFSANISSPSPDLTVFILMVVALLAFTRCLFTPPAESNERRFALFSLIALYMVGVTTKLSFLMFGAALIVLALAFWLWDNRLQIHWAARQTLIWLLTGSGLIGLPWMLHGIATSGYPLFPSAIGALPVDWRIPLSITTEAADWVYSFARQPRGEMSVVLSSWDWLVSWAQRRDDFDHFLFVQPFFIFIAGFAAYLLLWGIFRRRLRHDHKYWLPFIPAVLSGVFWFLTAPDPRFAGAAFWLLAQWSLTLLFTRISKFRLIGYPLLLTPIGIALVFVMGELLAEFSLEGIGFPVLPVAAMQQFKTDSGLVVNLPADPNNTLLMWDAPLPASPYKLPRLELRGADLNSGFRMRPEP